jgi:hypothetical protein
VTRFVLSVLAVLALTGCSADEWVGVIFQDDAPTANRIAECESRHQWDAVSPDGRNHGLMQINVVHRSNFERVTGQRWDDAIYGPWNVIYAKWLFDQQGWAPWSCAP